MINKFEIFLQKIDKLFPNPWYVEGHKQVRPVFQLGFITGVFIVILIEYLIY